MKFTDGYWLRQENVQASFASSVFTVEKIPNGMRLAAPERPIRSRADSLDITVLYIDITSSSHNDIEIKTTHFAGYDTNEPRFTLNNDPEEVEVTISDDTAIMKAGDITVTVIRDSFQILFEADGKLLTSCGFRNFGYMRVNKRPSKLRMDAHYFEQNYEPYMLSELSLAPTETIYGFGERFTPFVKNGQSVNIWNEDGGTSSDISYKNIPFYMSSNNYGVFVDHAGQVSFEVSSEKVEFVGFSVPGEELRYHLIYGKTPADIIDVYTALTGRPALPPAWSFGLWLSTSFKPSYDEETTDKLIKGMTDRDIPLRTFHFDCYWMRALHWCDFVWDAEAFPDPKKIIDKYHKQGLKVCCWINPYVAQDTEMFRVGVEKGYFLKRSDGKGIKQVDNWQPGLAVVDFTNPEAKKWYSEKIEKLLETGVDAVKTDFGERIPTDVAYYDSSDPIDMHNYYTFLYNQTVFETIEKMKGKGNAVLFARSATVGSQQFPIHWGGDSSASYASMVETLHAGLSFAMSGFAFWSHDIAGFEATATPDLYKRWAQFGLLSSHSRLHGSDTYRVPWIFDDEANDVVKYFSELKCHLMPYIYQMAVIAHEKGTPIMRPMPFEFPEDRACQYLDLQYMFGDSILVAPIFNDKCLGEFYLPEGKWTGLIDNEVFEGGKWYKKEYSYMNMPIFVKANSLIAYGCNGSIPDYDYSKDVTLRYYLPSENIAAATEIPDVSGNEDLRATAVYDGNSISFKLSKTTPAFYEIYLEDGRVLKGKLDGEETKINL
ncbi:MAG: alpha-xylosidase [Lachnospiraceae bacterium]|nr:alpha-xylosidase [Lachnospiraceae bacterium]